MAADLLPVMSPTIGFSWAMMTFIAAPSSSCKLRDLGSPLNYNGPGSKVTAPQIKKEAHQDFFWVILCRSPPFERRGQGRIESQKSIPPSSPLSQRGEPNSIFMDTHRKVG